MPPLRVKDSTPLYNFTYWAAFTAFTFGWGFRATGREHLPKHGPALILANHECLLDPILFGLAANRRLTYLARSSLFRTRLGSAIISSYGAIPIDRGYGRDGLQTVFEALERGEMVLMFPEGERCHHGELQELKAGVSLIVKKSPAPIIPAGIDGAFESWPRQSKFPRSSPLLLPDEGRSIAIAFGEPIPPEFYRKMNRDEILTDLHAKIAVAHAAAEKIRRKPKSS